MPSMFTILTQRRLRWLGHLCRMDDGRIPKDVLYGELATGTRPTGRPILRYKEACKRDLKVCSICPADLEAVTGSRDLAIHGQDWCPSSRKKKEQCSGRRRGPARSKAFSLHPLTPQLLTPAASASGAVAPVSDSTVIAESATKPQTDLGADSKPLSLEDRRMLKKGLLV